MTDEQWHLDKRIPVALIMSIMMGYAGGIWFMSSLDNRVTMLEKGADQRLQMPADIAVMKYQLDRIEKSIKEHILSIGDRK